MASRRSRLIVPRGGMSRRQFLARSAALGAAGVSLPAFLAACGGSSDGGAESADGAGSLFFENWPEYVDLTEGDYVGTVDRFIEATGISMKYTDLYNDNNEYFAKIQPLLGAGKTIEPDIIAPTSWMAGRLIGLGWTDKLPVGDIPNMANIVDGFVKPTWDPTGEYSMPWQAGMAGIAYNIDVTGREIKSVADLFDPAFKGKIGMLTEMRDTIGLVLLGEGIDPSTISTFDEAAVAFEKIARAKADGQIRAFTGNDYLDDLANGNFAACIGWSGDLFQLSADTDAVKFVIPEEGGTRWADVMVVPKGAKNAANAAKWMNYVYDPEQAAKITAYVQYISPVKGVQEIIAADADPEIAALAENPLVFPDDEMNKRLRAFANLSEDVEAQFDAAFSDITGA
jgi:spermidine/putrescine transport system substrate-binding protein